MKIGISVNGIIIGQLSLAHAIAIARNNYRART